MQRSQHHPEDWFEIFFRQDQSIKLLIDPNSGQIEDANIAAGNFYGYSVEKLKKMNIQQINVLSEEELKQEMSAARELKRNYFHFKHKLANGEIREVEVYSSPLKVKGVNKLFSVIHDISEEVKALNELEKAQKRFDLVVEATADGIWDWDLLTNEVYYSPHWKSMLGYEDYEIEGSFHEFENRLHPEDKNRVLNHVQNYISGRSQHLEIELRMQHKKGSWVHILSRGQLEKDYAGIPIRMVGSHVNITKMKQAESKISEINHKFLTTFDLLDVGILITDESNRVTDFNKAFENISGIERNEFLGKEVSSFPWEVYDKDLKVLQEDKHPLVLASKGETIIGQQIAVKRSTKTKWLSVNAAPMKMAGYGQVITFIDLTELITKEKLLKTANATKERFLSIIAHDLRSPLSAIMSISGLAKEELKQLQLVSNDLDHFLSLIHDSSKRTHELLNNLLYWSRAQTDQLEYNPQNLSVEKKIQRTVELLDLVYKNKEQQLEIDVEEGLEVFADRDMLETILRNLISNAIKFSPVGGRIKVQAKNEGDKVYISVEDNGMGIPKDKQATLFQIHNEYRMPGTKGEKGSGLGLVLCREFIKKHGGEISVESEAGKYTRFTFWFKQK